MGCSSFLAQTRRTFSAWWGGPGGLFGGASPSSNSSSNSSGTGSSSATSSTSASTSKLQLLLPLLNFRFNFRLNASTSASTSNNFNRFGSQQGEPPCFRFEPPLQVLLVMLRFTLMFCAWFLASGALGACWEGLNRHIASFEACNCALSASRSMPAATASSESK